MINLKKILFIPVIFYFNTGFVEAQTQGLSLAHLKMPSFYGLPFLSKKNTKKPDKHVLEPQTPRPIPLVFSVETLPFFCKIEHKMGLNQRFPLKFRLGDVEYVDELEGKRRMNK